jgi:short-subunit dehydrogenase
MTDYRNPRHVVITGSTGEIGGALALEYAAPGVRLTLTGRKEERLKELASQCESKGAQVSWKTLDVCDAPMLRSWIRETDAENPVDLLISAAGRNTQIGEDFSMEPYDEVESLVHINLMANLALIDALVPEMRRRKSGHIAIVASLAAYYGLVYTPTYCATKAALKSYGTSLRALLAPEGVGVSVILPGYVDSPMCRAMPGPKPFLMKADKAARIIRKGLSKNRARIGFPFPLNLGIWFLSFFPYFLAAPLAAVFGYGRNGRNSGQTGSTGK